MPNKKNIEFIDKNIEKCKELINDIENTSDELKGIYDEEEIIKARTEMKEHVIEQLKLFKEIKSILEAWEIAKKVLNHFDIELIEGILIGLCDSSEINKDEVQNFKKTLEVEMTHQKKEKENDFEKGDKNCTCSNCPINDTCIYAWDSYNTNNKCLLED